MQNKASDQSQLHANGTPEERLRAVIANLQTYLAPGYSNSALLYEARDLLNGIGPFQFYPAASYRRLTRDQEITIARQIVREAEMESLRAFLDDFYGEQTFKVTVQIAEMQFGPQVENILVFTEGGEQVPPNFDLFGWQELRNSEDSIEQLATADEDLKTLCQHVGSELVQQNVFLDYGIPPVYEHDLPVEAHYRATNQGLYTLAEETHTDAWEAL